MASHSRVPVAQYLRMSTEHQRYSLDNQSQAIGTYAEKHGFSVVQTYSDPARSGVVFRRREGLRRLIQDVVQRTAAYKAILVYDVSRWGRFQDCDEAAYYEFMCKSAGVPVHYCAESFSNDNAMPNVILKSLKRVMAGEYSRELGVKVHAAQVRLAKLGFRQGGPPGYGLRRLLVSPDGTPKQILLAGERKCLAADRVIQVAGPPDEVGCVREIYRMFVEQRLTVTAIARELNRRRIRYLGEAHWSERAVQTILTHPKYVGCNVYGRTSQKLYTRNVRVPRSDWTIVPGAFERLIEPETFAAAQQLIGGVPRNKSDERLLHDLRTIFAMEGRITTALIEATPGAHSPYTYRRRFGSLVEAYRLLGYKATWNEERLEKKRRVQALRSTLMSRIAELSGGRVSIQSGPTHHSQLRLRNGRLVTVVVCRCFAGYLGSLRWLLKPLHAESQHIALIALLNAQSDAFKDLFVVSPIGKPKALVISAQDTRLQRGVRLGELADFFDAVQKVVVDGRKGLGTP